MRAHVLLKMRGNIDGRPRYCALRPQVLQVGLPSGVNPFWDLGGRESVQQIYDFSEKFLIFHSQISDDPFLVHLSIHLGR